MAILLPQLPRGLDGKHEPLYSEIRCLLLRFSSHSGKQSAHVNLYFSSRMLSPFPKNKIPYLLVSWKDALTFPALSEWIHEYYRNDINACPFLPCLVSSWRPLLARNAASVPR